MTSKGASGGGNLVKFHEVHDPNYGILSPLSPHPVVVRHRQYPSLHHYFLCERFKDTPVEPQLQSAASVWELERIVREAEAKSYQREDWNQVKIDVMLLGNYLKFKQNESPRKVLLETETKLLVNHTPTDDFWGDSGDGSGKNLLGVVLMSVRERLRREAAQEAKEQQSSSPTKHAGGGGKARGGVRATRAVAAARQ